MIRSFPLHVSAVLALLTIGLVLGGGQAVAHDRWSVNDDATNCGACHGDFRDSNYESPVDGQNWGNLHNLHRQTMLNGDCDACHGQDTFPVMIASSAGGDGLAPIGCMGCHGREQDSVPSNPDFPNGSGAGLRQHHFNTGTTSCVECHDDADPSNYTPVGEEVLPPYYANPGTGHPDIPTSSCNADGSENFAGAAIGQDNDGDDLYDGDDTNCNTTAVPGARDAEMMLVQNFPNPFNPRTVIRYQVTEPGWVRLNVYTVNGELIRELVNSNHDGADTYSVNWNGVDQQGSPVASGLYIYRLETGTVTAAKQMVLLR